MGVLALEHDGLALAVGSEYLRATPQCYSKNPRAVGAPLANVLSKDRCREGDRLATTVSVQDSDNVIARHRENSLTVGAPPSFQGFATLYPHRLTFAVAVPHPKPVAQSCENVRTVGAPHGRKNRASS